MREALRSGRLLFALVIALTAAAPTAAQAEPAAAGHAAVRALWAGDGDADVDVWIGEVLAFAGLGAGWLAPYTAVAPGPARVALALADDDESENEDESEGPVGAPTLRTPPEEPAVMADLEPGSYYTMVLAGSDPDDAGSIRFALLQDRHATLPPAGQASLRFVHADPGGEPLSLLVRRIDGDGNEARRPPPPQPLDGGNAGLLARLGPLEGSEHVSLLSGRYRLWWFGPGEDPGQHEPHDVELRAATAYTMFATAGAGEGSTAPLLVIDAGAPQPQGVDE